MNAFEAIIFSVPYSFPIFSSSFSPFFFVPLFLSLSLSRFLFPASLLFLPSFLLIDSPEKEKTRRAFFLGLLLSRFVVIGESKAYIYSVIKRASFVSGYEREREKERKKEKESGTKYFVLRRA